MRTANALGGCTGLNEIKAVVFLFRVDLSTNLSLWMLNNDHVSSCAVFNNKVCVLTDETRFNQFEEAPDMMDGH